MALVNGCWFRAAAGGTGAFAVASAITGYMVPDDADAIDGSTYSYRASSDDESQWEIGTGVYTASGATLSRSVLKSSNSHASVTFSAAPKVALTLLVADIPAGGGDSAWEVIEDVAVASAAQVDIVFDPAQFSHIRVYQEGLSTGGATGSAWGYELFDSSMSSLYNNNRMVLVPGKINAVLLMEAFEGEAHHLIGDTNVAFEGPDANSSMTFLEYATRYGDLGSSPTLRIMFQNGFTEEPISMTSGRVIAYGLKKP